MVLENQNASVWCNNIYDGTQQYFLFSSKNVAFISTAFWGHKSHITFVFLWGKKQLLAPLNTICVVLLLTIEKGKLIIETLEKDLSRPFFSPRHLVSNCVDFYMYLGVLHLCCYYATGFGDSSNTSSWPKNIASKIGHSTLPQGHSKSGSHSLHNF